MHATLTARMNETMATYEARGAQFETASGFDSFVVRPDLGLVIGYASTADYMLEARGVADGRVKFRVNLEWFDTAESIPTKYRKARAMAHQWESVRDTFSALLDAKRYNMLAYADWREASTD